MKILFATEYYHPFTPGGTAFSLELLGRALVERGHEVMVVTPNYGAASREERDGVRVVRFPFWRGLPPGPSLAPARDLVNPLFHLLMARAVMAAGRRSGADVVHAQEKHALVGAFAAARWLRRPVFLSLRDYGLICPITTCLLSQARIPGDCGSVKLQRECAPFYLDRYIRGGRWRRLAVRASLAALYADARVKGAIVRRVDGVIGVSRSIVGIYGDSGRLPAARAHAVHNLPPPSPSPERGSLSDFGLAGRRLVLYVGKLSLGKGFPLFVQAAAALAPRFPDVSFAAAGDGDVTPATAAPVRLLGAVPHPAMPALYDLADMVVQPAIWPEPFSRVTLEAAAAGKPVVAARTGGIPEAVDHQVTGLLVERGDAGALADAIAELLGDERLRAKLGRQAAEALAHRVAPGALVDRLLAIYRAAVR